MPEFPGGVRMRKDWLLAIGTTLLTLVLALLAIRWLAPQLFGVPLDLRLVSVDESRVPFFELLFAQQGIGSGAFSVADPYTVQRGAALLQSTGEAGPHDLAGFRNPAIPNVVDIVAIGDSQTYGLGATMAESWPHLITAGLAGASSYSMALGGWSAPQYLYMLGHAMRLRPRVVVVAFYVGNDPIEAYAQVYGDPRLAEFRHPSGVQPEAPPPVQFPAPREDQWRVDLPGDRWLHFTPRVRRINVMAHPSADEGWRILGEMAARMVGIARAQGAEIRFTIIPTRELAYLPLLQANGIEPPSEYALLVAEEGRRTADFWALLERLAPGSYVEVTSALQDAILRGEFVYPNGVDGHPAAAGHAAIAAALATALKPLLPAAACGEFRLVDASGVTQQLGVADGRAYWIGGDPNSAKAADLPSFTARDLAVLQQLSAPAALTPRRCQREG